MKPVYRTKKGKLYQGDCLEVLRGMPDNIVDAVVTDPPYGWRFMGKKWDYNIPAVEVWQEVLRVLKPGGHVLVACGTRTQHRMACNIEDAGFEIRDVIAWLYGSGFPKSLDVGKAIEKVERGAMIRAKLLYFSKTRGVDGKWLESQGVASAASFHDWTIGGHAPNDKNWQIVKVALEVTPEEERAFERQIVGRSKTGGAVSWRNGMLNKEDSAGRYTGQTEWDITVPATDAARQWEGWGTALKPAREDFTLARKPLQGTVAENVLEWGTGALDTNGTRIPASESTKKTQNSSGVFSAHNFKGTAHTGSEQGRFPANVIHDGSDEVVELFPETSSGAIRAGIPYNHSGCSTMGAASGCTKKDIQANQGSAARFFYTAKASPSERRDNNWPTVKPYALIKYLVRLITSPMGIVLDPFVGSGTTAIVCEENAFRWIAIDREQDAIDICLKRLKQERQGNLMELCAL